ncbi:MAG: T9SS type A sorting domain-containing protein [Sediminibacterium sp.]|nr:T9SS type A sorting domain-containing protein [Sediminibacterium sp.]
MRAIFTFLISLVTGSLLAQNNAQVTNIINACPGQSNGLAVIKINTNQLGPYSFTVTGNAFYYSVSSPVSNSVSVTGLAAGVYNYTASDGVFFYLGNFNVNTVSVPLQAAIQNATICAGGSNALSATCGNGGNSNCSQYASATQTFVVIGTDTTKNNLTGWPCIYSNWYKNNRHQVLINASELTAQGYTQGLIKSVALKIIGLAPQYSASPVPPLPNFTIRMKAVNMSVLTGTFDNSGLTQVYSSASYTPVLGTNTHHLQNYFYWNGTSDLLIDFCYSFTNLYAINPVMESSVTNGLKCMVYYSDTQPACLTTQLSFNWLGNRRPNIMLGMDATPVTQTLSYVWQPSSFLNNSQSANPSVSNATASVIYTVTANTVNGCASTASVSMSVLSCLGFEDKEFSNSGVTIYPNPVTDQLLISSEKSLSDITVMDGSGKIVLAIKLNGSLKAELNVSDLPAGMYFLELKDTNGMEQVKKLSVLR